MAVLYYSQILVVQFQTDLTGLTAGDGQYAYAQDIQAFFTYNLAGAIWMPSARTLVKKSSVVVVGTTVGNTKIYTIENSTLKFYPFMVIYRAVNIAGVTTPPTLSIGSNSTNYNNIVSGSLLSTVLNTIGASAGASANSLSVCRYTG